MMSDQSRAQFSPSRGERESPRLGGEGLGEDGRQNQFFKVFVFLHALRTICRNLSNYFHNSISIFLVPWCLGG
jgi:hypothetical protein